MWAGAPEHLGRGTSSTLTGWETLQAGVLSEPPSPHLPWEQGHLLHWVVSRRQRPQRGGRGLGQCGGSGWQRLIPEHPEDSLANGVATTAQADGAPGHELSSWEAGQAQKGIWFHYKQLKRRETFLGVRSQVGVPGRRVQLQVAAGDISRGP